MESEQPHQSKTNALMGRGEIACNAPFAANRAGSVCGVRLGRRAIFRVNRVPKIQDTIPALHPRNNAAIDYIRREGEVVLEADGETPPAWM